MATQEAASSAAKRRLHEQRDALLEELHNGKSLEELRETLDRYGNGRRRYWISVRKEKWPRNPNDKNHARNLSPADLAKLRLRSENFATEDHPLLLTVQPSIPHNPYMVCQTEMQQQREDVLAKHGKLNRSNSMKDLLRTPFQRGQAEAASTIASQKVGFDRRQPQLPRGMSTKRSQLGSMESLTSRAATMSANSLASSSRMAMSSGAATPLSSTSSLDMLRSQPHSRQHSRSSSRITSGTTSQPKGVAEFDIPSALDLDDPMKVAAYELRQLQDRLQKSLPPQTEEITQHLQFEGPIENTMNSQHKEKMKVNQRILFSHIHRMLEKLWTEVHERQPYRDRFLKEHLKEPSRENFVQATEEINRCLKIRRLNSQVELCIEQRESFLDEIHDVASRLRYLTPLELEMDTVGLRAHARKLIEALRTSTVYTVEAVKSLEVLLGIEEEDLNTATEYIWKDQVYMRKIRHDSASLGQSPIRYFCPEIQFSMQNPLLLPRDVKALVDLHMRNGDVGNEILPEVFGRHVQRGVTTRGGGLDRDRQSARSVTPSSGRNSARKTSSPRHIAKGSSSGVPHLPTFPSTFLPENRGEEELTYIDESLRVLFTPRIHSSIRLSRRQRREMEAMYSMQQFNQLLAEFQELDPSCDKDDLRDRERDKLLEKFTGQSDGSKSQIVRDRASMLYRFMQRAPKKSLGFTEKMFLRRMEDQISRGGASFDAAGQQTSPVRRLLRRAGNFERSSRVPNASLGLKNTGVVDENTAALDGDRTAFSDMETSLKETVAMKVKRLYQEISLPESSDFATEIGLITDNVEDQVNRRLSDPDCSSSPILEQGQGDLRDMGNHAESITNFWKSLVQSQQNTSQTSLQGTSTSLSGKSGLWNRAVNAVLTKKVKKVSSDKETVRVHFMHVHDVEIPLEDAERLSAILPRYQFRIANFEEDNQKMVKPGEFLRKFAKPSPSWFVSRKKSLGDGAAQRLSDLGSLMGSLSSSVFSSIVVGGASSPGLSSRRSEKQLLLSRKSQSSAALKSKQDSFSSARRRSNSSSRVRQVSVLETSPVSGTGTGSSSEWNDREEDSSNVDEFPSTWLESLDQLTSELRSGDNRCHAGGDSAEQEEAKKGSSLRRGSDSFSSPISDAYQEIKTRLRKRSSSGALGNAPLFRQGSLSSGQLPGPVASPEESSERNATTGPGHSGTRSQQPASLQSEQNPTLALRERLRQRYPSVQPVSPEGEESNSIDHPGPSPARGEFSGRSPVGPAPPLGDKHSTKKSLPAPSLVVSSSPPVVEGGWRGPGGTPSSLVDSRGRSTEIRRINGENAGSVVVSLHRVDPGSGEGARKGSWTDVQSSSSGEDVDESEEEDLPWLKHSLGRLNRHRGNSPQLPVPNSPGSASHLSTSSRSSHRSVSPRLDDWKSQPGVQDKTVAATSLSPGPVGRKRSSSLLSTLRSQESANSFERSFVIEAESFTIPALHHLPASPVSRSPSSLANTNPRGEGSASSLDLMATRHQPSSSRQPPPGTSSPSRDSPHSLSPMSISSSSGNLLVSNTSPTRRSRYRDHLLMDLSRRSRTGSPSPSTSRKRIALGAGGRSGSSRKVSADVENQSQASVGSMGISSVTDLGFRGRFDQLQRRPSNSILSDVEKDRMARVQRRVFCT